MSALKALKKESKNIKIAGVTTLTSLNNKDLKEIGYKKKVNELVRHQAKLATKAKLDAIVCSEHEIRSVKKVFKKEIITPGIQIHSTKNDQKRKEQKCAKQIACSAGPLLEDYPAAVA